MKKLEELLNLPVLDQNQTEPEETVFDVKELETLRETDHLLEKIDNALPQVNNLDSSDTELDDLSDLAKGKFTELMDLGMNVDPRFSGVIFQTAGQLLGHAITAKTAKLDKKLRMVQLQLSKAKLDHAMEVQAKKDQPNTDVSAPEIAGKATVVDRNTLLQSVLAEVKKNKQG
jgi:hypothetical protein